MVQGGDAIDSMLLIMSKISRCCYIVQGGEVIDSMMLVKEKHGAGLYDCHVDAMRDGPMLDGFRQAARKMAAVQPDKPDVAADPKQPGSGKEGDEPDDFWKIRFQRNRFLDGEEKKKVEKSRLKRGAARMEGQYGGGGPSGEVGKGGGGIR